MNYQPIMFPPCPLCSVDGSFRQWRDIKGYGYDLKMLSDAHSIVGSDVSALVCTNCGNVQLFVNPADFKRG
jgi:hypothetical protein